MANDQLEIIAPNGEIKFFDLNPGRGITNIGRHPENDLVIDSEDVAQFHAVLDHRQKPYQLVVVSQETETIIEGQRVQPNVPHVLQTWDTIQLNGHSLVLIEGDGGLSGGRSSARTSAAAPALALATAATGATVAGALTVTPAPAAAPGSTSVYPRLNTPPAERKDDFVVTELTEREWMIDVEGIATTQLTVGGGDLVATFQVHVEGVGPPGHQEPVSNVRARAPPSPFITPPRLPTSRANTTCRSSPPP
jgi:pSer/pThr/pTyr-binding forkhead associated (FHA) protein